MMRFYQAISTGTWHVVDGIPETRPLCGSAVQLDGKTGTNSIAGNTLCFNCKWCAGIVTEHHNVRMVCVDCGQPAAYRHIHYRLEK